MGTILLGVRSIGVATVALLASACVLIADSSVQAFRDCPECPEMAPIPGETFAAGRYEVTFAQWDACVAAGGCNGYRPSDEGWGRGTRPVINVSWRDAQAYVAWLSKQTGYRYRLLTTPEWMAAAHLFVASDRYPWGDEAPSCEPGSHTGVNYFPCHGLGTLPVGTYGPNRWGVHDVLGNVGEWLGELYDKNQPNHYAIIGSSWRSSLQDLGGRGGGNIDGRGDDTGIRVARDL